MSVNKDKQKLNDKIAKETRSKVRKQLWVRNLLNIEDENTFGNGTQAALKTYPKANYNTAKDMAYNLRKDPYCITEIERMMDKMGLGFEHRVSLLHDIIEGSSERHTIQQSRNPETGEWVDITRQVSKPSFKERLDALKMLNDLDGTSTKFKTIVNERNKMLSQMRKKLTKSLEDGRDGIKSTRNVSKHQNPEKMQPEQSSSELEAYLTGVEAPKDDKA